MLSGCGWRYQAKLLYFVYASDARYAFAWQMMQNLLNSLGSEIFLLRYGDLPLPRHMMFEPGIMVETLLY